MRAVGAVLALIAFIEPAAAAHCGHGRIYRVSMGVCVGARSRLARQIEVRLERPQRLERPKEPLHYVHVIVPVDRPAEAAEPPPDPEVVIPYTLPGSDMWRAPRPSPWVRP